MIMMIRKQLEFQIIVVVVVVVAKKKVKSMEAKINSFYGFFFLLTLTHNLSLSSMM